VTAVELATGRRGRMPLTRPADAAPGLDTLRLAMGTGTPAERAWEAFVDAAPGGDIVQTAAWGRSKVAMGFTAGVGVARDAAGRIEGGGLIVAKRVAAMGGRLPLATVGYVARGPLVRDDDPATIERALDALHAAARAIGVRHLIVQPPAGGDAQVSHLRARGYDAGAPDVAPSCTIEIDLRADLDAIMAGMSSSQRRNLRKAKKLGVAVRRGGDADLEVFQALHAATAERQGFQPLSLGYLEQQWRALRPLGAVEIFLAASPDEPDRPVAGSWVTAFAGRVTDKIPGWTGEAPALQPNVACIWESLVWAKAQGFQVFDLGGVDRLAGAALSAGARGEGPDGSRNPAAFKARFGGEVAMLPLAFHRTLQPLLWPLVRFGWRRVAGSPQLRRFLNGLRNG